MLSLLVLGSSGTEPQSNATKSGANTALVASVVTVLFIITSTVTVVAIFIWYESDVIGAIKIICKNNLEFKTNPRP